MFDSRESWFLGDRIIFALDVLVGYLELPHVGHVWVRLSDSFGPYSAWVGVGAGQAYEFAPVGLDVAFASCSWKAHLIAQG